MDIHAQNVLQSNAGFLNTAAGLTVRAGNAVNAGLGGTAVGGAADFGSGTGATANGLVRLLAGATAIVSANVTASDFMRLGVNAAAGGYIRLPNTAALTWRNAANGADITGISVDGSNQYQPVATATANGFESAEAYRFIHGTVSALAPTSIGIGAGLVTVHVTAALVAANNTSRRCHFELEQNGVLATLGVLGGDVDLKVSQRNDGTFRVQSLLTGFYVDGAGPTITGTTVSGIAWSATVAAGVVTLQVQQGAATQSVTSILRIEDLVTQVAP
jgi:hypothetical protein